MKNEDSNVQPTSKRLPIGNANVGSSWRGRPNTNKMSNYEDFKNAPVEDPELISLRFISELEKIMDKEGITRADLSRMLGTSKSYLTQLWRGDKIVNMNFISKCCIVLNIKFAIKAESILSVTPHTSP